MSLEFERPTVDHERDLKVRRVLIIEAVANALVLVAKAIVGGLTGSLAIIGDAIHSGSDLANNIVALTVMRSAVEPPDREHPYGHRKYETLAVFVLASLLVVTAFEIGLRSITGWGHTVERDSLSLCVMIGVLVVNIAISAWETRQAKLLGSAILEADARHTVADVLTTVAVIAGWQLSAMGYVWVDSVCALGVAALVMYLAYGLFKEAVPILVDQIAIEPEKLSSVISRIDGVQEVRSVRSRSVGSEIAVDATVAVDGQLTMAEAHMIADRVEAVLHEEFHARDVVVHVEPG